MPSNVEIKARVRDPERLRLLAERLSDTSPEIIEQHDTFFQCPQGRLKLRELSPESGELIFYTRADVAGTKRSDYLIARSACPSELLAVLAAAFGVAKTVTKTRVLLKSGQTRIHLDSVRDLGCFMELEVVLRDGQPVEEGHRIARELMTALEIEDGDLLEGAYADLLPSALDGPMERSE
jgi:adenylate cyclase class IV